MAVDLAADFGPLRAVCLDERRELGVLFWCPGTTGDEIMEFLSRNVDHFLSVSIGAFGKDAIPELSIEFSRRRAAGSMDELAVRLAIFDSFLVFFSVLASVDDTYFVHF